MTSQALEQLTALGIDFADAMDRFDENVGLYERLAMKYLNDSHFVNFVAAMEAKDFDTGYSEAHSLKGVAGNLSFKTLYEEASFISKQLFEGDYQSAEAHIPQLTEAHEKVIRALEEIRDNNLLDNAVMETSKAD